MVEIETLFQTKTAKNERPFGAALTYTAYIRDSPPPPRGKKRVADYEVSLLTQARLISLSGMSLSYVTFL